MEAIQTLRAIREPDLDLKKSRFSKKVKKYYTEFEELFVHKTQAEKRRELFGKDPLVNL